MRFEFLNTSQFARGRQRILLLLSHAWTSAMNGRKCLKCLLIRSAPGTLLM